MGRHLSARPRLFGAVVVPALELCPSRINGFASACIHPLLAPGDCELAVRSSAGTSLLFPLPLGGPGITLKPENAWNDPNPTPSHRKINTTDETIRSILGLDLGRREAYRLHMAGVVPAGRNEMLHTKEHDDLVAQFDRENGHFRLDKEPRDLWRQGNIYQDGKVNDFFLFYRKGYAFGKCIGREESA